MRTRDASTGDADAMSRVLREIVALTGRERPSDADFVARHYIANPASIRCTVAVDEAGDVLGFQSLVRAEAGNRYDVPEGWGIIGTHISPRAHRRGVGTALFAASRAAAERAGIEKIDAYIGANNPSGLRYYEAMGFRTYREPDGIVQKVYVLAYHRRA
jgi:GNAT superfamily N-acetyltransferase